MHERSHPLITVDRPMLAALLAPIAPHAVITTMEPLAGGYRNTNYRVRVAGRAAPIVVRLYAGGKTVAAIEAAIMARLHGRVPLPEVLFADPDGHHIGIPYLMLSWVEGERLDLLLDRGDPQIIAACAYAAGQTLAAIHTERMPQAGFFAPDLSIATPMSGNGGEWGAYITQCVQGNGQRWLGVERTERLLRFVADHQAEMDTRSEPSVLLHADYKGQNLLLRPLGASWEVAAVLDWEFAFAGSPNFDIGQFLRIAADQPPVYAQAFARGYQEGGGSLTPGWQRQAKLLDLLNLAQFLDTPEPRPQLHALARRWIDVTLAELPQA